MRKREKGKRMGSGTACLLLLAAACSLAMTASASEGILTDGANVAEDAASATGYTVTFVLADDGYKSVQISGNFQFVPVLTEDCDFDMEYVPQMDENGMAIKDENNKSLLELGRDMSGEAENIKADTVLVDEGVLPVKVEAFDWVKEYAYEDPSSGTTVMTTLDHWSGTTAYDMELEEESGKWVISIPLPSGAYNYTYLVTGQDDTVTEITDPANQEPAWELTVPSDTEEGFEDTSNSYRQAFARNTQTTASYAYVPFDEEKQVYDWSFLCPVDAQDSQIKGTILVDVPYETPADTIVAPEVAQAYADGESEQDGVVDFTQETNYLCIYLPEGYDANRETPYKVVYASHGGHGGQQVNINYIRAAEYAMNMEDWDEEDDFLIVTYNCYASSSDKAWPSWYDWKVLANITQNIIPYMEANYNVSTDESGRALIGYSAGGAVAHYGLLYYSDTFDYFGIWGCGESTTVPGDYNAYVKYIHSYEQYLDAGLQDETVLIGSGFYDVPRAGGYTVEGTKDAVQTIRFDHTYRAYEGLRDVIGVENLVWGCGHANHDDTSNAWLANQFFTTMLWK